MFPLKTKTSQIIRQVIPQYAGQVSDRISASMSCVFCAYVELFQIKHILSHCGKIPALFPSLNALIEVPELVYRSNRLSLSMAARLPDQVNA